MPSSSGGPHHLLHLVAGGDQPTTLEVAKRLLSEGVDPNVADEEGLTPLHNACHWDRLAMCQLLLAHGADPLLPDNHGRTPLAMSTGATNKFLERLLAKNEREKRGIFKRIFQLHFGTRIHKAFSNARKKMRRLLKPGGRPRSASEGMLGGDEGALADDQRPTTSTPLPPDDDPTTTGGYVTADEGDATIVRPGKKKKKSKNSEKKDAEPKLVVKMTAKVLPVALSQSSKSKQTAPLKPKAGPRSTKTAEKEVTKKGMPSPPSKKITPPIDKKGSPRMDKKKQPATDESTGSSSSYATAHGGQNLPALAAKKALETEIGKMPERQLRVALKQAGVETGPMKGDLRAVYERRLLYIRLGLSDSPNPAGHKYSRALEAAMAGRPWGEGEARAADESLRSIYSHKGVSAFCYLLLDPRKLPALVDNVTLASFVAAIFYVGKGTRARPLQHLIDARRDIDAGMTKFTDKIHVIAEIWAAKKGVVSLQMSHNIGDEEAFTREAVIIEALGIGNLSNARAGKMYGTTASWPAVRRAQLGTLLLVRARNLLAAEGHIKQIFPDELPLTLKPFYANSGGVGGHKQTKTALLQQTNIRQRVAAS